MTFKEAMEHYRAGTASEEEKAMVEEELEKMRLIEEYQDACWKEEAEEWTDWAAPKEQEGVKNLRSRLRMNNLKLILISVLLAILVILGVWFGILPAIEKQYWDPEENSFGFEYQGRDIDVLLDAYNELFEDKQAIVNVQSRKVGFASYELNVQWWDRMSGGDSRNSLAKLEKGKLELPPELSRTIPVNVFERASWPEYPLDEENKARYRQMLEELPEYVNVTAHVSFEKDLTMQELIELEKKLGEEAWIGWVGVRNSDTTQQFLPLCGFDYGHSGIIWDKMDEFYPNFSQSGERTPEKLEQHFKSLLEFVRDRELAERGVGAPNAGYYQEVLDYVEQNGVMTYGCTLTVSPKIMLSLLDNQIVSQIWPSDVNFKI